MTPDIKIIVCYHKPGKYISNDIYLPVHVGKEISKYDLPIQGDNEGDNISSLNYTYCELTGLYWAWKNIKADYIGLCHYRRFFTFETPFISNFRGVYAKIRNVVEVFNNSPKSYSAVRELVVADEQSFIDKALMSSIDIKKYIESNPRVKIIALKPVNIGSINLKTYFSLVSGSHHVEIIEKIIKNNYPTIFPFLESALFSNTLHLGNMTICHKTIFDDYCIFLFSVLKEYRKVLVNDNWYIDCHEKSISRISGYLAEILTSVYVNYISKNEGSESVKLLTLLRAKI